jgi:hypothetical protein
MGKTLYLLCFVSTFIFSCGGEEKKENDEAKDFVIKFNPKLEEKKEMEYAFEFDLPSKNTKVSFLCSIEANVKSTQKNQHDVYFKYNHICAKGNYDGIDVNLCAGDSVKKELLKLVIPVFSYNNSIYKMRFDDRMRKLQEEVFLFDSSKGNAAPTSKMQFFTVLPEKTVKPGDTWEESLDWSAANNKKAKLKYTLEKIENGIVFIFFKGEMKSTGEGFGQEYVMKAVLGGKIQVDEKTGWTIRADMKQNVTMTVGEESDQATYTYKMSIKQ